MTQFALRHDRFLSPQTGSLGGLVRARTQSSYRRTPEGTRSHAEAPCHRRIALEKGKALHGIHIDGGVEKLFQSRPVSGLETLFHDRVSSAGFCASSRYSHAFAILS